MGKLCSQGCCQWAELGREQSSSEGKPRECCRDGCFDCCVPSGAAGSELVEGPGSPGCARAVVAGDMLPPNGVLGTQLAGARRAMSPLWPELMGSLWMLKAVRQWGPGCHSCWAGTLCRAQCTALPHSFWGMEMGTLDSPLFPILPAPNSKFCPTAAASKLEISMPDVVEVEVGDTARIECNFYIPENASYTYIDWFYVSAGLAEQLCLGGLGWKPAQGFLPGSPAQPGPSPCRWTAATGR